MGQPTKSEPRNQQLNLSLKASEFERLKARAEAVGMRPVHFSRALILDEKRKRAMRGHVDHNATKLIYAQLIRLGNNLNQMVRHLHKHGGPLPRDLEPLLQDIRNLIAKGATR